MTTQTLGLCSLFKHKEAKTQKKSKGICFLGKNILLLKNVTNTASVNLAFCQIDLHFAALSPIATTQLHQQTLWQYCM